jgi:hypothetical protein
LPLKRLNPLNRRVEILLEKLAEDVHGMRV